MKEITECVAWMLCYERYLKIISLPEIAPSRTWFEEIGWLFRPLVNELIEDI